MQGPDVSYIYQTQQKQRIPRAFNLGSRSGSRPRPPLANKENGDKLN